MDDFFEKVYEIVAKIPSGKVATYGQIADMLGFPNHARTVGWAMSSVPHDSRLPCHRVIYSSGELTPYRCFGPGVQRELLESEGVTFKENGRVDLKKHLWQD